MSDERIDRRSLLKGMGVATLGTMASTFPTSTGVAHGQEIDGPTGIHVGYGPDAQTMARIGWTSDSATNVVVEYGRGELDTTAEAEALPVPGKGLVAYDAELTGLAPGTTYQYRVVEDGTPSETFEFTTAPDASTTDFTVTTIGDHGIDDPDNEFQRADDDKPVKVIDTAKTFDPDMHLGIGDLAYANGYPFTWDIYFDTFEAFYATTPFMTVPGNHEKEPGQGFSQYDARLNQLMPIQNPELGGLTSKQRWYDFQYGNAAFIGLNTSADACGDYARGEELIPLADTRCRTDESVTYNERQKEFVERALKAAHDDPDIEWIVCYFHSSFWTDGDHPPREDLRELWGPFFDEYGVDLVLAGHNHSYERSKPIRGDSTAETGTTYVVNGTGGSGHYGFNSDEPPTWTAFRTSDYYGPVQLDFTADRIKGQYVHLDGTVVDEFTITKTADGEPTQQSPGDATRDSLAVTGSRRDDGSTFTGGQTNQIDVTGEAEVPIALRDRIPAEWNVLDAGDVAAVVDAADGTQLVYFDVPFAKSQSVTYFVETPSDPAKTGTYTLGPAEAREENGSGWVALDGTESTETVVAESSNT